MTAPSYTEDLTDLSLCDEAATANWDESTDTAWDDQGPPAFQDGDYAYIQGSYSITADCTKVGVGTLIFNYGSTFTIPTDGAMLIWMNFANPNAIDTYTNGGLRALIGSGFGTFWAWDVGGSDYGRNPYGGWQNFAVNDTITPDDTVNSYAGGSHQYVGGGCKVITGIGKGEAWQVDAIRYGRCSSIFEYGETADYCTFAGFAAQNDNTSYRWGLIQTVPGGYLYKGKMTLGTVSNACDFRDSNKLVLIDDTPKVTANFNTIEVNNASSRVDWDNVIFKALGTQSPGRLVCNANADLNWDACQFFDMGAFTFGGTASECTNGIFQGCGQVDSAGGTFTGTKVLVSTVAADTGAFVWNVATDPNTYLANMTFSKGTNAHHAIDFGTSVTSNITLTGIEFTGFGSTDDSNDSTVRFLATSGSLTLSLSGCTVDGAVASESNFSVDDAAGIAVTLSINPVTVAVHAQEEDADDIEDAVVFLKGKPWATLEGTDISLNENGASADTITRTVGSFITDGFDDADFVTVKNSATAANDGTYTIVSVVALTITLAIGDLTADDSSNADLAIAGTGPFPVEDIVTIVNSGTTATVTHTAHGMANNDYVQIFGGTIPANEGVWQITYINANSYSYTMLSTPGASPTGTITSTFVALYGLTDVSGDKSTTRVYSANQPVTGWIRKASSSPYYKEAPLDDIINSSSGLSLTGVLVLDE